MAREPCTIELYSGTVRLDAVRDRLRKQLGRLSRAPEQGGGELEDGAEALRRRRARCRPRLARSRWARACGPAGPQRPVLFLSRMATHPSRWDRLLCPHGLAASIGLRSSREWAGARSQRSPELAKGQAGRLACQSLARLDATGPPLAPPELAKGSRSPSRSTSTALTEPHPQKTAASFPDSPPAARFMLHNGEAQGSTHQVGPLARKFCVRWLQELLDLEPGAWGLEPRQPSMVLAVPG
jgi:hypothetical protein